MIRRRQFLLLLGAGPASLASLAPALAQAQARAKRTIGFLGANTPSTQREWTAAFVRRLAEHGWREGDNLTIEYRWGEGKSERFAEIAAELVSLRVDLIATSGTAPALAAKRATSTIPIVFATSSEPVETGLVASLARPGGNVTGLSTQVLDLATKRIELLREVVPGLRRVAILYNSGAPASVLELGVVSRTLAQLGLASEAFNITKADEIAPTIDAVRGRAEALLVITDPFIFVHRARVNAMALGARLPTMHSFRDHVEAGGLLAYGPSYLEMFRRAADFVDRILRGAKPQDIPVEQPTKFDLTVNLITARALGVSVPATILARADEVIE